MTGDYASDRFVVRDGARIAATPLLVALVAVEVTDLVFALDSIPAVFGVTSNLFVVFTSNAFAVLGLRALYFCWPARWIDLSSSSRESRCCSSSSG